jgi:peptide/nickel transport system permease protein
MKKGTAGVLIKRFISSLVVLFLLISFIFILVRISPGDPVQKFISPDLNPQLAEKVRESFNLNKSIVEQYFGFLSNAAAGNFGISYNYRIPVLSVIFEFLPFTLIFTTISFIIQMVVSFILALISVRKINSLTDRIISKVTLVLYATPAFVVGVFLIYFFSEILGLFPSSGVRSFDAVKYGFFRMILDYFYHLALPIATLSLIEIAIFYKYLRDNIEEVYNRHFVLNLRANGFREREILVKHVIPNAVNPLIVIAGIELGILFGGTLIVEVIFGLPGMGRLTINAILTRDYPLIIGCSFIAGILIIITNFLADIVKVKVDKRLLAGALN